MSNQPTANSLQSNNQDKQTEGQGIAIKVEDVSKTFKLPHEKQSSLKGMFLSSFRRKAYEMQEALKNVSLEVKKGEFFGIVGRNGSGKSTLLKCIAGVYIPNKGEIKVNGSLVPFIELGVGFNPDLSGRDNVFLNGALLGFSRKRMEAMYDEIVEFAELEDFMDQKLKNYSSGMQVRLAFSIAIKAKGDILLLDEVLAVGDAIFQQKCFDYFNKLKKEKQTILLVSHNIEVLRQYCTGGILIEDGKIICRGGIDIVADKYLDIINKYETKKSKKQDINKKSSKTSRRGTGKVLVTTAKTLDKKSNEVYNFNDSHPEVIIKIDYKAMSPIESPVFGIVIKDATGRTLITSNNLRHNIKTADMAKGESREAKWYIPNIFNNGEYLVSPAVADSMGQEIYDWVDDMATFKVRKKVKSSGIVNLKHVMVTKSS